MRRIAVVVGMALMGCGSDLPSVPGSQQRALEAPAWYQIVLTYPLPTSGRARETMLHVETDLATDSELVGRLFAPAFDRSYHDFEAVWDGTRFPILWEVGTVRIRLYLSARGESCSGTIKLPSATEEVAWIACAVTLKMTHDRTED